MSLIDGSIPSELKLAKVVPIFKSGESDKVTNYRPISVYPSCKNIRKDHI